MYPPEKNFEQPQLPSGFELSASGPQFTSRVVLAPVVLPLRALVSGRQSVLSDTRPFHGPQRIPLGGDHWVPSLSSWLVDSPGVPTLSSKVPRFLALYSRLLPSVVVLHCAPRLWSPVVLPLGFRLVYPGSGPQSCSFFGLPLCGYCLSSRHALLACSLLLIPAL